MNRFRKSVFEGLDNARENDYYFEGWTLKDIALDMLAYDVDSEESTVEELIPLIREWRIERGLKEYCNES
jgi:hypothetical protein